MREFFKGWKRKVGVVTLVMACVLTVGWVRSFRCGDQIDFTVFRVSHIVDSEAGSLKWRRWPIPTRFIPKFRWQTWRIPEESSARNLHDYGDAIDELSLMPDGQFQTKLPMPVGVLGASYWSIVLPLTLLSAGLMLSKQPSVKRPVEPPKDQA